MGIELPIKKLASIQHTARRKGILLNRYSFLAIAMDSVYLRIRLGIREPMEFQSDRMLIQVRRRRGTQLPLLLNVLA